MMGDGGGIVLMKHKGKLMKSKEKQLKVKERLVNGKGRLLKDKGRLMKDKGRQMKDKGKLMKYKGKPKKHRGKPKKNKGKPKKNKGKPKENDGAPKNNNEKLMKTKRKLKKHRKTEQSQILRCASCTISQIWDGDGRRPALPPTAAYPTLGPGTYQDKYLAFHVHHLDLTIWGGLSHSREQEHPFEYRRPRCQKDAVGAEDFLPI